MIETRDCFACGQLVYVHDCHYQCNTCGYAENWQDISGRFSQKGKKIDVVKKEKSREEDKSRRVFKKLLVEEV